MRLAVHAASYPTQDGQVITLVRSEKGVVGVATRRRYEPGQTLACERVGPHLRAVEDTSEAGA